MFFLSVHHLSLNFHFLSSFQLSFSLLSCSLSLMAPLSPHLIQLRWLWDSVAMVPTIPRRRRDKIKKRYVQGSVWKCLPICVYSLRLSDNPVVYVLLSTWGAVSVRGGFQRNHIYDRSQSEGYITEPHQEDTDTVFHYFSIVGHYIRTYARPVP